MLSSKLNPGLGSSISALPFSGKQLGPFIRSFSALLICHSYWDNQVSKTQQLSYMPAQGLLALHTQALTLRTLKHKQHITQLNAVLFCDGFISGSPSG